MSRCFAKENHLLKPGAVCCSALKVNKCSMNCRFFKTKQQIKTDIAKVYKRIKSLSVTQQNYISDMYYHGKRPWLEQEGAGI